MSEQKIEVRINPEQFTPIEVGYAKSCQQCLLCENTREVPNGYGNRYPWVCDECKEAMAFVKEFRSSIKAAPAEGQAGEIKAEIVLL